MCRWFAYISPTEPCLLEDVLVTPKHSLANQVHEHYLPKLLPHHPNQSEEDDMKARNMLFNIDGLGIAWYTSCNADFERGKTGESADGSAKEGVRPAMYKTVNPPVNDMNFRSICANTETRALFAHIRAASGTAIATVNNHPFVFGRHSFMHNGVVSDFTTIRRAMTAKMSDLAFANVHGSTDSEHLAALYMTSLSKHATTDSPFEETYTLDQMAQAMQYAVTTALEFQLSFLGSKRRPNSLNLCATDGEKIVAYRFRNHATSQPPSLYYSRNAGVTLNRKYPGHPDGEPMRRDAERLARVESHGEHLIIASEPSTYKIADWKLIGKNQRVLTDAEGVFRVEDVPYEREWDAVDPES